MKRNQELHDTAAAVYMYELLTTVLQVFFECSPLILNNVFFPSHFLLFAHLRCKRPVQQQ